MLSVSNKASMLSVTMLPVILPSVIMLSHYAECHYAECHYAECHYAECHCAKCRGTNTLAYYTKMLVGTSKMFYCIGVCSFKFLQPTI